MNTILILCVLAVVAPVVEETDFEDQATLVVGQDEAPPNSSRESVPAVDGQPSSEGELLPPPSSGVEKPRSNVQNGVGAHTDQSNRSRALLQVGSITIGGTHFSVNQPPASFDDSGDVGRATNLGLPILAFSTANQSKGAPLVIHHVPYGTWVEIEGLWHNHRPKDPTESILVYFNDLGHPRATPLPSVVVRFGRDPNGIRLGTSTFSKQIVLLPHQTIEFDYFREFGDGPPVSPPSMRIQSARSGRLASRPAPDSPPPSTSTIADKPASESPCSTPTQSNNCNQLEFSPLSSVFDLTSKPAELPEITTNGASILQVTGSNQILPMLTNKCRLKAAMEVTFTNAAGTSDCKAHFDSIEFDLVLEKGSTSTNLSQLHAEMVLTKHSLTEAIKTCEGKIVSLEKFLIEVAPVAEQEVILYCKLCTHSITFYNDIFSKVGVEYKLDDKIIDLKLVVSKSKQ